MKRLSEMPFCRKVLILPLAMLAFCLALPGQSITGDILGTVYDPSHAVAKGAKVVLTNTGQGWKQTANTDELGNYTFAHLPPGKYSISVTLPGFETYDVPNIELLVDQRARVDVNLSTGKLNQQVTVTAGAPLLDTDSSAIGHVVGTREITTLPLNGRNFLTLSLLATGAAPQGTTFSSVVWGRTTGVSLAGTRDINVSYLVDGAETRDERYGGTFQFSSVESIQEFKVQENFVDAQYGFASAVVSAITASGTNQFHGALYEFLRNSALDSRNFFDRNSPAPYHFNQFGGSIGGPVILPKYNGKDKTFFFFNYEGQRSIRDSTSINTVPTLADRQGNLSDVPAQIYNPISGNPATGLRTPFAGNLIPASQLDPISQKLLSYWPAPNAPGLGSNYITTVRLLNNYNQYTTRLDHTLGENDRLMFRYSNIDEPFFQQGYAPLSGQEAPLHDTGTVLQYTHIVSPRAVNEFRFAYTSSNGNYSQEPTSENLDAQIGIQNASTDPAQFGLPSVSVAGYTGFGSFSPSITNVSQRFQFADDYSYTVGKHNLKFGADIRRLRYRQTSAQDPRGFLQYQATYSNPGPGINGGSALADFMLGTPEYWQVQLEELGFDGRMFEPSFYFQDNYRVNSRLTLTLGVRWEYMSPWTQPRNNSAYFDLQTQQVDYALQNPFNFRTSTQAGGQAPPGITDPQYDNWADRIGLAYQLTKHTVIRMGHGLYWDNVNNNQFTQSESLFYPFVYQPQATESSSLLTPAVFNTNLYPARPVGTDLPYGPTFALNTVFPNQRRPYTNQWNINIQHTLRNNYLIQVGYMGSETHKLPSRANFNQAALPNPNIPFQDQPLQNRRPYPAYGDISVFDHMGNASYHGLTASLEKRYSAGFSFLGSYTWSKAMDSGTDINSNPVKQPGDVHSYWGLADINVGQRFVGSYTLELPVGKGKRYLSGAGTLENGILGGWQVNGITTYSQGIPIEPSAPASTPDVSALFVTPNRSCSGRLPSSQRTVQHWFDTTCFSIPAAGTFGNSARTLFSGPGMAEWDISLFKNFKPTERSTIQFRLESFNVFNHTNFNNPASSLPSSTFGTITSAKPPRQNQVALKFSF